MGLREPRITPAHALKLLYVGIGVAAAGWYVAVVVGVIELLWWGIPGLVALLVTTVIARVALRPRGPENTARSPESVAFDREALSFLVGEEVARKGRELERLYVYIRLLTVTGHLSRVSEFVDLSTDLVSREITSTWTLPPSATAQRKRGIWFPVMTPLKGSLVDRLEVHDSAGGVLPIVAVREAHAIAVAAWYLIVDRLADTADLGEEQSRALRDLGGTWIIRRLERGVAQDPAAIDAVRDKARAELRAALTAAGVSVELPIAKVALRYIAIHAVRFVVTGFVSAPTEHVVVAHRYRMDSSALMVIGHRDRPRGRAVVNYVKAFIGRSSHVFRLDLATVHLTRSFHLELLIPRGNYFAMAALINRSGDPLPRPPAETRYAAEPWYYRISHLGHRYLHFYSRNLGRNPHASEFTFRVLEVPWLSLMMSVSFATISTICIAVVAFMTDTTDERALGIAQIVVALPITATLAWLSIRPPSKMIARSAMGFGLSVAALAVLALTAIVLFGEAADWDLPRSLAQSSESLFYIALGIVGLGVTSLAVRISAWFIDYSGPRQSRGSWGEEASDVGA